MPGIDSTLPLLYAVQFFKYFFRNLKNAVFLQMMMSQGYIKSSSPGIFSLMPLALRSLEKMCLLIDEVMETVHAQKVLFPTLIQDSLLKTTGKSYLYFIFCYNCHR